MRRKSELSDLAKQELEVFVAVNGQSYAKYTKYAEKQGWYLFSERYFKCWVDRRRERIQSIRRMHLQEVQRMTTLDRAKRIEKLERACGLVQEKLNDEPDAELLIKLLEQERKLLEAIAKERGEWLKVDDGSRDLRDAQNEIAERIRRALPGVPAPEYSVSVEPNG